MNCDPDGEAAVGVWVGNSGVFGEAALGVGVGTLGAGVVVSV